jgi:uncharacterized membrane protein
MLRLATRPRYSTEGLGRLFTFIFLVFMSLSNIYLLADVAITAGFRQPYPFFRTQEEVAALEWLRDNTEGDDLVLASYETGNYVASRAGNPVVLGHWAETVNWEQRVEEIGHFFGPAGDLWREAFLARNSIDYLWFGPQERALGEFDPDQAAYLKPVYTGIETIIYARR